MSRVGAITVSAEVQGDRQVRVGLTYSCSTTLGAPLTDEQQAAFFIRLNQVDFAARLDALVAEALGTTEEVQK